MAIERSEKRADERAIKALIIVAGTVPIPGQMYERVTEFHASSWRIERIDGGFAVSRGEDKDAVRLEIVNVPCCAVVG